MAMIFTFLFYSLVNAYFVQANIGKRNYEKVFFFYINIYIFEVICIHSINATNFIKTDLVSFLI